MDGYNYSLELNNFGIMVLADVLKIINLQGVCFGVTRMISGKHMVFFKDKNVAEIVQRIHNESIIESPLEIAIKYIKKS